MLEVVYKKRKVYFLMGLVVVVVFGFYVLFLKKSSVQTTNNAYVQTDFSRVAPKISGFIDKVFVSDNQVVKAGELLVTIDDSDYKVALTAAKASLDIATARYEEAKAKLVEQQSIILQANAEFKSAQAELGFAQQELVRYQHLAKKGAGSVQNAQQAETKIKVASAHLVKSQAVIEAAKNKLIILKANINASKSKIEEARAEVEKAALAFSYTNIVSPVNGVVAHRLARLGNYVTPGSELMAIVPIDEVYVVANFQETQLAHVKKNQPVTINVDMFNQHIVGRVDSLAPATGLTFAAMTPDNATGNFTKVVQRIPVKISLDKGQPLVKKLKVGMSVEASIHTGFNQGGQDNG